MSYHCVNLLWKPTGGWVRFVCVIDDGRCYILMCSDLGLCPKEIITIYSWRWKTEVMFLRLKNLLGGFCYHFWTRAFPKSQRGGKVDYSDLSEADKDQCRRTIMAIERFVNLAGIALGLLQYLSITHGSQIWRAYSGWLRTYSSDSPSEGVVQSVIRAEFFASVGKVPVCRTLRLIQQLFRPPPLDIAA